MTEHIVQSQFVDPANLETVGQVEAEMQAAMVFNHKLYLRIAQLENLRLLHETLPDMAEQITAENLDTIAASAFMLASCMNRRQLVAMKIAKINPLQMVVEAALEQPEKFTPDALAKGDEGVKIPELWQKHMTPAVMLDAAHMTLFDWLKGMPLEKLQRESARNMVGALEIHGSVPTDEEVEAATAEWEAAGNDRGGSNDLDMEQIQSRIQDAITSALGSMEGISGVEVRTLRLDE